MFGGGGSIAAMQASFRSNRAMLKNANPFRKRLKDMKTHHIEGKDHKKFTVEEMAQFKQKLKKQKEHNQKVSAITMAVMILIMIVILVLLNQS